MNTNESENYQLSKLNYLLLSLVIEKEKPKKNIRLFELFTKIQK